MSRPIPAKPELENLNWKIRSASLSLDRPRIMGILNITPDSFSDGGQFLEPARALEHAASMKAEGADLIDIGGESTRPGAKPVPPEEEWRRIQPVLAALINLGIPLSVDTRNAETARRALESGAAIVNDVGCARNAALLKSVGEFQAGYVLMHSRGDPATMMGLTEYQDVVTEVAAELRAGKARVLEQGIAAENICLDPGFGFAKTPDQNWELLEKLPALVSLGHPVLVGLSRKRMLRERVGEESAALLGAGLAAAAKALAGGALIFRVHDVAATRGFLQTLQKSPFPLD